MPKTRLQLVNSVLALVGENQLLSTTGNLGTLVVDTINTSIANIVQETRSQVFESTLAANVTSPDYLTSALTLPDNTAQVYSVLLRVSTGLASGDKLFSLDYLPLEDTPTEPSYSVVGKQLFVSPMVARPFTLRVHTLTIPVLPINDGDDSGLPDIVIPAVQHAAAAILALSYLDDANQASLHRNVAEQLIAKLKQQYGNNRARTYNVGGSKKGLLGFGGVSTITGGVAYATAADAALTGNATLNGSPLVVLASITDGTWQTPTLVNSWTNFGGSFAPALYKKKASGTVVLKGTIANATVPAAGTTIFTLPVGFRPPENLIFLQHFATTNPSTISTAARVTVLTDGTVRWDGVLTGSSPASVVVFSVNLSFETT